MLNNTPLALLTSDNAMAVRIQKAMNSALDRSDFDRYYREADRLDGAMNAPGFDFEVFKQLATAYGVDY